MRLHAAWPAKATVALALPATTADEIRAVTEGALLGAYAYDTYLAKKHEPIGEIVVLSEIARSKEAKTALATATDDVPMPSTSAATSSTCRRTTSIRSRSRTSSSRAPRAPTSRLSITDEKALRTRATAASSASARVLPGALDWSP